MLLWLDNDLDSTWSLSIQVYKHLATDALVVVVGRGNPAIEKRLVRLEEVVMLLVASDPS